MKKIIGFLLLTLTTLGANAAEDKQRAEQLQFWMYNPKEARDNQQLNLDHTPLAEILQRPDAQLLAAKEIERIIDLIRSKESPVSSGVVIDLITLCANKQLGQDLLEQLKALQEDVTRAETAHGIKGPQYIHYDSSEDEQE